MHISITEQGEAQPVRHSFSDGGSGRGSEALGGQAPQSLKVLHSLFSNGIGGTERHLAELASAQAQAGHEVIVMLRSDRNPYDGVDSLREWLHPQVRVITAPRRWPLIPLYFMVRRLQPDIIHTHHRRDSRYLGMVAPAKTPVIGTLHMPFRPCDYRRHQGIICVSPWQLEGIPTHKGRLKTVIPNWISPLPPAPLHTRASLRQQLALPEGQKLLGAVGRLTAEKGVEDLVAAFLAVAPANVTLCIFGEGECRPAIEAQITAANAQNRIRLMGYEPDIRRWYAAMDGFVLPSHAETFGLVLLEAMTAKLPILSTRTQGAWDVLRGNTQVHWAEAQQPRSLTAALATFLPHLGEVWDYPTLANYQPEQAFTQTEALYRELLAL